MMAILEGREIAHLAAQISVDDAPNLLAHVSKSRMESRCRGNTGGRPTGQEELVALFLSSSS